MPYWQNWKIYIFLFYFANNICAIDLFNSHIKNGQTIAIYTGAFDPPHLGHDEVIRYAISHGIDYVIVVPDSKFNRYKPFMTSVKQRNELLSFLYNAEPLILTTTLNYEAILSYLSKKFKNIKRISIIGSDNFLRHIEENSTPKLKADGWLIIPRDKDKNNPLLKESKVLDGKPVKVADIKQLRYQGYSSTNIRNLLRSHTEFYSGLFNPSLFQLPIDCPTRNFIRDFKLYQNVPLAIAESGGFVDQIKKAISEQLLHYNQSKSYNIINAQQEGIEGLSGNLIFFVTDCADKKIITVKTFVTYTKNQQYESELSAIALFDKLNLKYSMPVKKLFSLKKDTFNLLGMEYVNGKSLESLLKELDNQKSDSVQRKIELGKVDTAFRLLGSALAELHVSNTLKIRKITKKNIKKFIDLIDQIINEIEVYKNLFEKFDIKSLRLLRKKLIKDVLQNPGYFSYLHGDAQPGNFFIDPTNKKIIMIDLADAAKYFDDQKNPKGFPAHEYYQFLSSMDLAAVQRFNLSSQELASIKKSFMDGYKFIFLQNQNDISTFESLNFFKFYWTLRGIQFDLLHLKYVTKDNPLYKKLLSDAQSKLNAILV